MKKLSSILFVSLFLFSFIKGNAFAQQDSLVQKYGVSFPISQLGNCENISSCRLYCDDPTNSNVCIAFAKEKGFYDAEGLNQSKERALKNTKSELGCDSEVSCRNLCEQTANFSKCSSFARRYNLDGGVVENPGSSEIIKKAETILGCNSLTSCRNTCEKEENRSKCSEFARQAGLRGGEMRVGPGGCTSEATCSLFCSNPDNYKVCQGFAGASGGNFTGPGGCNSEESCKNYCEQNPNACGYKNNADSQYITPVDMCNRTPGCYWGNNSCNCSSKFQAASVDPAAECIRYSGCVWSGNSCRCNTPIYTSNYSYSLEEHKASCISGGCKWSGSICDCAGTNGPAIECGSRGCSWINSSCQCSASTPIPNSSSSTGSSMSKEQQEYYCKAGGGSCDWSSGYCYCKGYTSSYATPQPSYSGGSSSTTSTTNSSGTTSSQTTTSTNTMPNTAPPGMTRDSQEAGCRSCGGTCNWNGDFCNCQCGGSSTTNTSTTTQSAPPPADDPSAVCANSGGTFQAGTCVYPSSGTVQGTSIAKSIWEWLLQLITP